MAPTHFGQRYFGTDWSGDNARNVACFCFHYTVFECVPFSLLAKCWYFVSKASKSGVFICFCCGKNTTFKYLRGWSLILFCMLQQPMENKDFIFVNIQNCEWFIGVGTEQKQRSHVLQREQKPTCHNAILQGLDEDLYCYKIQESKIKP